MNWQRLGTDATTLVKRLWERYKNTKYFLPTWPSERVKIDQLANKAYRILARNIRLQEVTVLQARDLLKYAPPESGVHEEAALWLWTHDGYRCDCGSCFPDKVN